jgi:hypothetical protein
MNMMEGRRRNETGRGYVILGCHINYIILRERVCERELGHQREREKWIGCLVSAISSMVS